MSDEGFIDTTIENAIENTIDITVAPGPLTPLVVSVPHAGTLVPALDAPVLALSGKALLRDADLYVDRLFHDTPKHGATLVVQRVTRYVLDVNRAPDDVDRDICPEIEKPGRPSARGLCWRTTTDGAPVLTRPLTRDEVRSRTARIHKPWHDTLAKLLEERRQRFGYAILLDAHSMPSLGRAGHTDTGSRRADIVPGDVRGASCGPAVSQALSDHFARAGFSVRPNDPYMGGYNTRHHGRPARGVHAIQLELNRDLYMDEEQLSYTADRAAALVPVLMRWVERLRHLDPR